MKKKGFTLIELIVSFCLVSAIVVMLFQLIFTLKELYVSGNIKTMMLNRQGIMTRKIYEELNSKDLTEIKACGISCLNFNFLDGSSSTLSLDVAANTITYGNYTMELTEDSHIGTVSFDTGIKEVGATGNYIFKISIPIESKLLPDEDFGIYIIKYYNSNKLLMTNADNISLSEATITANNIKLNIETMKVPTQVVYNDSTTQTTGYFMKIFNESEATSLSETNSLKYNNSGSNFSSLVSLSTFKSTARLQEVKNEILSKINISSESGNKNVTNEAKEHLQEGYYEIVYGTNNDINNNNYFIQGNDFSKNINISEFIALSLETSSFIGLDYNKIIKNTTKSEKVWIRVDDYINKYGFVKLDKIKE